MLGKEWREGDITSIEIHCIQSEEDFVVGEDPGLFLEDAIRTIRMPCAKDLVIVLGYGPGE